MQKRWICGAKGQIGRAINEVIDKLEYKILDTDIDDLDITDTDEVLRFGEMNRPDVIINCAGLTDLQECEKDLAKAFKTNALGARNLSIVARKVEAKLVHISTDEVYGSLKEDGYFTEKSPIKPSSPYSASKASSDLIAFAYHETFKMNVNVTNCSNNYGPYQHNEKLIPHMIKLALNNEKLPVYGEGKNIRDWLYVEDHCKAIDMVFHNGKAGERYNIGGHNEKRNIEIVKLILQRLGKSEDLIEHVDDRKGHDYRYAIDPTKIKTELGWEPETKFEDGIVKTIDWYLANPDWLK